MERGYLGLKIIIFFQIQVKTSRVSGKIQMVRVRNPWGDSNEWKGAWSDG